MLFEVNISPRTFECVTRRLPSLTFMQLIEKQVTYLDTKQRSLMQKFQTEKDIEIKRKQLDQIFAINNEISSIQI